MCIPFFIVIREAMSQKKSKWATNMLLQAQKFSF
jgi:hypothetical protein